MKPILVNEALRGRRMFLWISEKDSFLWARDCQSSLAPQSTLLPSRLWTGLCEGVVPDTLTDRSCKPEERSGDTPKPRTWHWRGAKRTPLVPTSTYLMPLGYGMGKKPLLVKQLAVEYCYLQLKILCEAMKVLPYKWADCAGLNEKTRAKSHSYFKSTLTLCCCSNLRIFK